MNPENVNAKKMVEEIKAKLRVKMQGEEGLGVPLVGPRVALSAVLRARITGLAGCRCDRSRADAWRVIAAGGENCWHGGRP